MRTATTVEGSGGMQAAEFAREAEKLGLDICWVAEAWGADAPSLLGYLAARTESMLLGSGVIQVGTRSPVTIAQTAMTLAHLSEGRFLLGLADQALVAGDRGRTLATRQTPHNPLLQRVRINPSPFDPMVPPRKPCPSFIVSQFQGALHPC